MGAWSDHSAGSGFVVGWQGAGSGAVTEKISRLIALLAWSFTSRFYGLEAPEQFRITDLDASQVA